MGDKEKKRVGVTLTKLYLDAMDGLVRGGVYARRSDLINDALRRLFKHYGIEPFGAEETKIPKTLEPVDQDELQLKDETNEKWVEAWKKATG